MIAIFILTLCFGYKHSLFHTLFPLLSSLYVKIQAYTCNNNNKNREKISDDDANIKNINEKNLSKFCNTKKGQIETT